jgi:elongation factor G
VRVTVYDGKHHPVDSKEIAFVSAGRKAFLDALTKARPVVLEPIVNLEVEAPESFMGDVAGDLSSRRGQVKGTRAMAPGVLVVEGQAPLGELEGYSARLKAMTQGRASWTMSLSHYELAPPQIQQHLATEYQSKRKQVEED